MNKVWIVVFAAFLGLVAVGCQQNKAGEMADCCSMCSGDQKMTADGKCEMCLMAVDVCPKCEGPQKMTADSKCDKCGAAIAHK